VAALEVVVGGEVNVRGEFFIEVSVELALAEEGP
jgi:hypothetical protein